MGFFGKLFNWFRGKGFKENEPVKPKEENILSNETAEEHQYTVTTSTQDYNQEEQIPEIIPVDKEESLSLKKHEEEKINQEFNKAKEIIESKPKREVYESKIDNSTVNRTTLAGDYSNIGDLRPQYEQLLTANSKLDINFQGKPDTALLNILIENRQSLQHRFEAEFIIDTNNQANAGFIRISGILLEHTGLIYSYLNYGDEVDPTSFKDQLAAIQSAFEKTYGAIGGDIQSKLLKRGQVTDIKVTFTFA